MTGMVGYAIYTHEMSYNIPKIDESDPLSIRIKSLKSRILKAQRELEGSEPTIKQIISPPKEEDINKMFFGDKDLLAEETIPIDRKKNVETVFEFLNSDKISESMKQKVAAAMKDTVL